MNRTDLFIFATIAVILVLVLLATGCGVAGDIAPHNTLEPIQQTQEGTS